MEGRLQPYHLTLIIDESYLHLPAITARLTSTVSQRAIGEIVHVTSFDVAPSLKQTTAWIIDAKQRLSNLVS